MRPLKLRLVDGMHTSPAANTPAPRPAQAPQPVAEINLTLDVLEPMGNEIFVYARSGEPVIVARVVPQSLPEPGQTIRLAMDLAKLYFFDVDTEKSISAEHSTSLEKN